ncbi:UDP-glucose:glycoprotein glucosyltransferase-domain-containing protein [Pilobolus umbonatus]|nr:UDP-glucose:glycoprotein glucosyltransferase-domain-containing protein [Pilobolus umbonatus]
MLISKALFGVIAFIAILSEATSPTVDLTLVAPWSAPHLLIEVAETIATYNETAYTHLLPHLITLQETALKSDWTPKQVYEEALQIVSVTGADELDFLRISLAVHEAAPRIETYHTYYEKNVVPSLDKYDSQCESWLQVNNQQFCDLQSFNRKINSFVSISSITLLPFDHVITQSKEPSGTIVLYTTSFTSVFGQYHHYLETACKERGLDYVIRYRPSNQPADPLYLSGYGVELALKNTDYLVIDDRTQDASSKNTKDKADKKSGQSLFSSGEEAKIEPLTPKEIETIGLKAAQYVAASEDPLLTMTQLTQDFPKYAKDLSAIELDESFKKEILENQKASIEPGMNAVWFNGRVIDESKVDPFYLVRAIRSEFKLIQSLKQLGLSSDQALDIISSPILTQESKNADDALKDYYDVRDTRANPFVIWWNDLEKDSRYKSWPTDVYAIFQPIYPGQLHSIRKNLYNLLFIEDLATEKSLNRVINEIQPMIQRLLPVHVGLVAVIKEDDSISTLMSKSLNYIVQVQGRARGMAFLKQVLESIQTQSLDAPTLEIVQTAFADSINAEERSVKFEEAMDSQNKTAQAIRSFMKRLDIETNILFFNGKLLPITEERPWTHVVMGQMQEQVRIIQSKLYSREMLPDDVIYDFLLDQPYVSKIRNTHITVSATHPLYMLPFDHVLNSDKLVYLSSDKGKDTINMWIMTDLNTHNGLQLAHEALLFAKSNNHVRVALIHSKQDTHHEIDTTQHKSYQPQFSDLLYNVLYSKSSSLDAILQMIEHASLDKQTLLSNPDQYIIPGSPIIEMELAEGSKKWDDLVSLFETDGVDHDFTGIILNGRIIGPLSIFDKEDFNELYQYENERRIKVVAKLMEHAEYVPGNYANSLQRLTSIIELDKMNVEKSITNNVQPSYRNRLYERIQSADKSKLLSRKDTDRFLDIALLINPLTKLGQKWAPLFHTLSQIEGVSVTLYLNPESELKELPLKRFYRYVLPNELHFNSHTGQQDIPTAFFDGLPLDTLYTLGVDTTNAWHVTVKEANMDLDNILFTSSHEVVAVYELENILVEGHCLDLIDKSPPRGLEFEIDTASDFYSDKKDTLVMANFGYFQLKALPGMWTLGLREGRSSEVYSIYNVGTEGEFEWHHPSIEDTHVTLALTSFEGLTVLPLVQKNPGMEKEDVLENPDSKKNGIWSSLSDKLFGKKDIVDKPKQAEINIFSVASGKLYERFLSIMTASVMKHTQSTVKFWFIENFLSPEFKDFVPHMAKEYGFDYEMITYKWPSWLRSQHEKQRTIWGYKILFLDVLFPLGLDKVIFVDADQIVRTDLKELIDMDLKGAPYGYTPFCTDRTEMDGFRFWKEGYWKSHLRGKPYHISALYVVDLVRFRQMAAGDRLRAQYQQLSADPNSLANLDQDLPNNMQDSVPIFSLPQEWLWCETWCSDESLRTAKTIDLCNNPLTKEPKLDRARRQIPEWETYDNEINHLRTKAKGIPDVNKEKHLKDEL